MQRGPTVCAALCLLAAGVAGVWWSRTDSFRPTDRAWRASALAVNFHNFGAPPKAPHQFHPGTDGDPVRTYYWKQVDHLEAAVLAVFDEAETRRLDGHRDPGQRTDALDLIFASTHSARVAIPGAGGERVGDVISDRSQPSPARAGMLAVFAKLAESHPGRFRHVQVETVFLLNCGSVEDTGDARTIDRAIRALTGRPPRRILTTSDKVNPDYRDICAGFATGKPITIYDSRPGGADGTEPHTQPRLHIAGGGTYHFGTGAGRALSMRSGTLAP